MKGIKVLFSKNKYALPVVILMLSAIFVVILVCHSCSAEGDYADAVADAADISQTDSDASGAGDSSVLLVCCDETQQNIIYMCIFDFRIYSGKITVTELDASTACPSGGTYASAFAYAGIDTLEAAVEDVRMMDIDKYVIVDKDGFYSLFDIIGKVKVDVEEAYTYISSDKSNVVEAGSDELDPGMLYTYFTLTAQKSSGSQRLTSLVCDISNAYVSKIDETGDVSQIFNELVNCVRTDFTISDFTERSDAINYIVKNDVKFVSHNDTE